MNYKVKNTLLWNVKDLDTFKMYVDSWQTMQIIDFILFLFPELLSSKSLFIHSVLYTFYVC